jgi:hypothetical protein
MEAFRFILALPIGSLLALDTETCPWHRCETFRADRRVALHACPKAAIVYPAQCTLHVTQQTGLAVYVSNREISLRGILNLIHLVSALLDRDSVPASQHAN